MPDITCNRCGTITTWNPYCPTCGAYLEFAGTPAWHPGAVADDPFGTYLTDTEPGAHPDHAGVIAAPAAQDPIAELPGHAMTAGLATHALLTEQREIRSGNRVCPACGHANADWRALCEHCGATLPGAVLAPPAPASYTTGEHGKEHSLGPERHEWVKWVVIILAFALLGFGLWYFLFGPKADQTRTTIVVAAQTLWEFVDPTSGVAAPVSSVAATSSLPGTLPMSLADSNSRTFWASEVDSSFGAGSAIVVTFSKPVEIDRLLIQPGIQNGQLDVRALATPMEVTVDLGMGEPVVRTLHIIQEQADYQQLIEFPSTTTSQVRVTVNSVYPPRFLQPGTTVGSVAISSLDFLRVPSRDTVLNDVVPTETLTVPGLPQVPTIPAVPALPTIPAVPALPAVPSPPKA